MRCPVKVLAERSATATPPSWHSLARKPCQAPGTGHEARSSGLGLELVATPATRTGGTLNMDVSGSSTRIRIGDSASNERPTGQECGPLLHLSSTAALREDLLKSRVENSRLREDLLES